VKVHPELTLKLVALTPLSIHMMTRQGWLKPVLVELTAYRLFY